MLRDSYNRGRAHIRQLNAANRAKAAAKAKAKEQIKTAEVQPQVAPVATVQTQQEAA